MNLNCSASSTVKAFRKVCYSYKREYFWRMKMYQNQILRVQEWSIIASCLDGSLFHVWLKQESSISGHQRFLSTSLVRILYEKLGSFTGHVQKVILKVISSADDYWNFCLTFGGYKWQRIRRQHTWPSKEMTKWCAFPIVWGLEKPKMQSVLSHAGILFCQHSSMSSSFFLPLKPSTHWHSWTSQKMSFWVKVSSCCM